MEMSYVRYFLAVAETLNFTRAAERCRVRQPSLTRAIKKLEEELGGDLFYRERSHTHLTELGRSMLPLLKQCYDSAQEARTLAVKHKRGEYTTLRLAISHTISMELLARHLKELDRALPEVEVEYFRGGTAEIIKLLKTGGVELAVAGPLVDDWDRLDSWSLFEEEFALIVSECHPFATQEFVELSQLHEIPIMVRPYCENYSDFLDLFSEVGVDLQRAAQISRDGDLVPLVKAGLGACIAPRSLGIGYGFRVIEIRDMKLTRNVCLYSVAGRKRTAAAATFTGILCSKASASVPEF